MFNCPTCDAIPDIHAHFEERAETHGEFARAVFSRSTREFVIQALVKAGLCLCPALRAHHENQEVSHAKS